MSARISVWAFIPMALLAVVTFSPTLADDDQPTTPEEKIRQELAKKVTLHFDKKPLTQVAVAVEKIHGIEVEVDHHALDMLGVDSKIPITFNLSGVTLRTALRHMLGRYDLTTIIRDEALVLTSMEEAGDYMTSRVHPVSDLIVYTDEDGNEDTDFDSLILLIESIVHPESWDTVGGPGSMNGYQGILVFAQSEEVHNEITELLAALRKVSPLNITPKDAPPTVSSVAARTWSDEALVQALARKTDLRFEDIPLVDIVEQLARRFGVPMLIDAKALENDGISSETPVIVDLTDVKLASGLRHMLRQLCLTYTIASEVILITTLEEEENHFHTIVYPVADLFEFDAADRADFDSLIDIITSTILPESWDQVGGPGSLEPFDQRGVLVCSQTHDAHGKIISLLAEMRKHGTRRTISPEKPSDPAEIVTVVYNRSGLKDAKHDGLIAPADLQELVVHLVEPESWGGDTYLKAMPGKLVVRHRRDVQEKVEKLLERLGLPGSVHLHGGFGSSAMPVQGSGGGFFNVGQN